MPVLTLIAGPNGSGKSTLADARSRGYQIHLLFVALNNPEKSIARIRTRVERGGHFIADVDVKRRYARSLANLVEAIRLADIARIYDNSGDRHRAFLVARSGILVWKATPLPRWAEFLTILEQNV